MGSYYKRGLKTWGYYCLGVMVGICVPHVDTIWGAILVGLGVGGITAAMFYEAFND